jgi:hypothetical protein
LTHLKQVAERVFIQRQKIDALRQRGLPADAEEEQLGSLLRDLDVLKTHLANIIAPIKPD